LQGHGAGKALTEYFIEKATREGAQRIGLSTYIDNLASIHIVEQYRFVRQASFILAEAKLDGPARSTAELSRLVSEVPFDEARPWILSSASIAKSCDFMSEGWKFWPVARPSVVAWPPFEAAIGIRSEDGSLRSLLVVVLTTDPARPRSTSQTEVRRTWTSSSVTPLLSIRERSTSRR
jgi:hypothetical protein